MQTIWNVLGIRKQVKLLRSDRALVIMKSITEEEEKEIDKSYEEYGEHRYTYRKGAFVSGQQILMYGEVDINKESDIEIIKRKNILNDEAYGAPIYYTGFNYKKGIIKSNFEGIFKWYNTWDKLKWFKYNYCLIGKPKRIIVYKLGTI